jgi:hypothetical protein
VWVAEVIRKTIKFYEMTVILIGARARYNNAKQKNHKTIKCTKLKQSGGALCSYRMHYPGGE